jgi:hypothetical protein
MKGLSGDVVDEVELLKKSFVRVLVVFLASHLGAILYCSKIKRDTGCWIKALNSGIREFWD